MRILSLVAVVGIAFAEAKSVHVSRTELGEWWPLTVESGTVMCDKEASEVWFVAENKRKYALNGRARSASKYREIDEIWSYATFDGKKAAWRKDISPLLKKGLELCSIK